jgi:hypothetical protein
VSLNLPGLIQDLIDLATDPPTTADQCAARWADAMNSYAATLTPPSTQVATASEALHGSLTTAFSDIPGALALIEQAFVAFSAVVALGMPSPVISAGIPPPPPVGFATLFGLFPPSTEAGATAMANLINTWMLKGTATPIPPAAAVPWL